MKLAVLTTSVLIATVLASNDPALNYRCPEPDCKCYRRLGTEAFSVQVNCNVGFIKPEHIRFTSIQANSTSILFLTCEVSLIYSMAWDGMFSHLHDLRGLSIDGCSLRNLPEHAFQGLIALEELMISGASELVLHPDIFLDIPQLQSLSILSSGVTTIPSLCSVPLLFGLNVSDNRVANFDDLGLNCANISVLNSMNVLDFHLNRISVLPRYIGKVTPNLRRLSASDNVIDTIPAGALDELNGLYWMDLTNNSLTSLPERFLQYSPNIRIFGLAHNPLNGIPKGLLSDRVGYVHLDLAGLNLRGDIWDELDSVDVETLRLEHNRIKNLSRPAFLSMQSLTFLYLQDNLITDIPVDIFNNQRFLQHLDMSHNRLSILNESSLSGLEKVMELLLGSNKIHYIHHEALVHMTSLTFLNLTHNALSTLPDLSSLSNMKVLDISFNNIDLLPASVFGGLKNLQKLYLQHNQLGVLPGFLFRECPYMRYIFLQNNFIHTLENNAFYGIVELEELRLDVNNITDLGTAFKKVPIIRKLYLSNNRIKTLHRGNLPKNVVYLNLNFNKITSVYPYTFSTLISLKSVDLSFNELETVEDKSLEVSPLTPTTPLFSISGNRFQCDCNLVWIKRHIMGEEVGLSLPKFIDTGSMVCYWLYNSRTTMFYKAPLSKFLCDYETICGDRCPCCDFDGCDCKHVCPDKCSCYVSDKKSINIIRCDNRLLRDIPKIPPGASEVFLDGNNITGLQKLDFITLSKATILYLNDSNIESIENRSFAGLSSLKVLHLDHNFITQVTAEGFEGIDNLIELYLDHNHITSVDIDAFALMSQLHVLHLHNNDLITVSFDLFTASPLTDVRLSGNKWTCNCSFVEPFKDILYENALIVKDMNMTYCIPKINQTSTITDVAKRETRDFVGGRRKEWFMRGSVSNRGLSSVPIKITNVNVNRLCNNLTELVVNNVTFDTLRSYEDKRKIGVLAAVASLVFLVIVLLGLLFWKRYFVKIWLYSTCGVRVFDDRKYLDDKNKQYDAFVSYSSKDEHYVVYELAPLLELGNPRYKLCLHYRDFPVGASIAESIIQSIEASRRTIMILSDNFLNSEWCRYEFQAAFRQVLKDKMNRIIVVMLHDINFSNLDKDLQFYLKTRTYLKHNDPWFREKIHYALPEKPKLKRDQQSSAKKVKYGYRSNGYMVNPCETDEEYEQPVTVDGPFPVIENDYEMMSPSGNVYEEIGPGSHIMAFPLPRTQIPSGQVAL